MAVCKLVGAPTRALIALTLMVPLASKVEAPVGSPDPLIGHVHIFKDLDRSGDLCKYRESCRLISEAVVFESRGEPEEGQKLVIDVILNRVKDKRFPDSVKGVLTQPKQFSYINDMHKQKTPKKEDVEKIQQLTHHYLKKGGNEVAPEGVLWYHRDTAKPIWRHNLVRVGSIGRHVYYREE